MLYKRISTKNTLSLIRRIKYGSYTIKSTTVKIQFIHSPKCTKPTQFVYLPTKNISKEFLKRINQTVVILVIVGTFFEITVAV